MLKFYINHQACWPCAGIMDW